MKRNCRQSGFTLVEVIAACALGSFVALVAVGTLHAVAAGREKFEQNSTAAAEVGFAADMLRKDLSNIYRDSNAENIKFVASIKQTEYGAATDLTFYTVNRSKARSDAPEGDVYEVQYTIIAGDDGPVLVRRLWPYPVKDVEPGGVVVKIAENISVFGVRYLSDKQWEDEWPEEMESVPELVEVTVAAAVGEGNRLISENFYVNFPRAAEVESGARGAAGSRGTAEGTPTTRGRTGGAAGETEGAASRGGAAEGTGGRAGSGEAQADRQRR